MILLGYIGALVIGIVLGLTGGGGSILTVPILVYLFGLNTSYATAYSLFVVGTTSTVGAVQNFRMNRVAVKTGLLFALPSFTALYLTRLYLVPILPKAVSIASLSIPQKTYLMLFFAAIMLWAAYAMLKPKNPNTPSPKPQQLPQQLIQNALIGVLIGIIGAGGGFLIIPSLVIVAQLPIKKAVGTSLFIIALNSLIGFLGDLQTLTINWHFLLPFTLLSIIGIFIGTYISKYVNEQQLKKIFAWFVIIMAVTILILETTHLYQKQKAQDLSVYAVPAIRYIFS